MMENRRDRIHPALTTASRIWPSETDTVCIDIDSDRVQQLNSGVVTLDEAEPTTTARGGIA